MMNPGSPYPLGATFDGKGTNFALFSANATSVTLCLFDNDLEQRHELLQNTDGVWHGYFPEVQAGQEYGYRVDGPFDPHQGHRFNPAKLLLDPYARVFTDELKPSSTHLAYDLTAPHGDLMNSCVDNAAHMPKCLVTEPLEPLNVKRPKIHPANSIIYELHTKGFSKLNEQIAPELRGTYAGLGSPEAIDYLKSLGITAVELLPVHFMVDEIFLQERGLTNYWGYNSLGFFAPSPRYQINDAVSEFRAMTEALHEAGIEVLLDVVYNHTAEGDHTGPLYSFKGIDNASYYCLKIDDARFYENHTGCGNTLNIKHPRVLQLVMDSLRFWVTEMGVDGFRFDLASVLGREGNRFRTDAQFFSVVRQDPVLSQVKLIAEPWDVGPGGYQLGRFPNAWFEWNDRFRDTVRRYWRGDDELLPEFARRLHGSCDLFEGAGRRPWSSINYIASHDGFTLRDLVSFKEKHNEANREKNKDGHSANFSCNNGHEGPSNSREIEALRLRQSYNLLTTLFIAQGTPMLLAGDELGQSQQGNNNAYCQDNEMTWLDWTEKESELQQFTEKLIALRKEHPLLNRTHYQHGQERSNRTGIPDISWHHPRGEEMQDADWHEPELKVFGMLLAETEWDRVRTSVSYDDGLLVIFNSGRQAQTFCLPDYPGDWYCLLDTNSPQDFIQNQQHQINNEVRLADRSCQILSYNHMVQ